MKAILDHLPVALVLLLARGCAQPGIPTPPDHPNAGPRAVWPCPARGPAINEAGVSFPAPWASAAVLRQGPGPRANVPSFAASATLFFVVGASLGGAVSDADIATHTRLAVPRPADLDGTWVQFNRWDLPYFVCTYASGGTAGPWVEVFGHDFACDEGSTFQEHTFDAVWQVNSRLPALVGDVNFDGQTELLVAVEQTNQSDAGPYAYRVVTFRGPRPDVLTDLPYDQVQPRIGHDLKLLKPAE